MRNTLQLAQRLGRHLDVPDASNLDGDAALDVLSAINAGIQAYYREAPAMYRRTTVSHTLRAPETVSLDLTQYSNAVEDGSFTDAMRGCSVRIPGVAADNEVTSGSTLLDDWLGATGTVTATVWFDAVPIEDVIERVCGDVRLLSPTGQYACCLRRNPALLLFGGSGERTWCRESGQPTDYALDPVGGSQGGEPATLLRVHPMPAAACTVRFEAQLGPKLVTFGQLQSPAKIPVPEERVDDILLPLCEAELTVSPLWRDASKARLFLDRRDEVLGRRLPMMPSDYGTPHNRVGTPCGF